MVDRSVDDPKLSGMRRDYEVEAVAIETHCKSDPKLHMVQAPASKLRPKEEVKIVRYMVGCTDWKRAAEAAR